MQQMDTCRILMEPWIHGLLECILGHGKVIAKLMINTFVNRLWLVYYINMCILCVCLCVTSEISGMGHGSTTFYSPALRASPGELHPLQLAPRVAQNRAVANGRVGRVLAGPIFAPEETTPKKLTFATMLSFAKGPMFIVFVLVKRFKNKRGGRAVYDNRDYSR